MQIPEYPFRKEYEREGFEIVKLDYFFELQNRLQKQGLNIHALAAHPGVSITGIQHAGNPNFFQKGIIWIIGKLFAGKPADAAKSLVMASVEGKSGEFYGPTGLSFII